MVSWPLKLAVKEFEQLLFESQRSIKTADGWTANVIENHDQSRAVSKWIKNTTVSDTASG
jgi:Alpha amylase, catalytic domain.